MDSRLRALERQIQHGGMEEWQRFYAELQRADSETAQSLNPPGKIPEEFDDYDWEWVFKYADAPHIVGSGPKDPPGKPILAEEVKQIIASVDGERDSDPWQAIVRLWDGRFAYLEAGCDYTGWD